MAFDLNSAKPVEEEGFDLSSAKEIQETPVGDRFYGNMGDDFKALGAAVGDTLSGIGKIPVQALAAVGGKIARPDLNVDELWKAAGDVLEEKTPSFGNSLESERAKDTYGKYMKPFELLGRAQEWAGDTASELTGSKDVGGTVKVLSNFLPIPGAKVIGKGLEKAGERLTRPEPQAPKSKMEERLAELDEPVQQPVPEQPPADLEFWKQRAEQLQKEALAKEAPPPVLRAQQETPFNPNPLVGTPEAMEGLARSTEGISYQEVPPDGVVPRDSMFLNGERDKPMLRTPRGNEWAVDENGIPVRQGLPESTVAPDYINRYMRQDEPARNDLGNAIQEANGPRLAADNPFGSENLSGPMGAPEMNRGFGGNERGAINMDVFDDAFVAVKELANGLRLVMQGHKTGPRIQAIDHANRVVGETKFTHDTWARGPIPTDNLEASWVTTDPKKTSAYGKDADRLAPTTKSPYKGLAAEMYQFAADQKNDIIASSAQTPEGQAMWQRFHERGLATNNRIMGGQRGALNLQDIVDGFKKLSGTLPREGLKLSDAPRPDTELRPISSENIAKKEDLRNKANALRLKGTPYDRVTTAEEAIAGIDPKADISSASPDSLRSGSAAVVRTNTRNTVLNFVRNQFQEARNNAERLSKTYVTDAKTGLAAKLKELSKEEKVDLADFLQVVSKKQLELTPELMQKGQLTPKQMEAATAIKAALDARYASMGDALMSMGFEPPPARKGYLPGMFSGAYTSFMGHYKDGNFVITGIAQADTWWGHKKAVEKYKGMGDEYAVEIRQPKRKLRDSVSYTSRVYDGFNDMVARIAERDPRFAEIKAMVDQHAADEVRALYRFDVHEMKKKGVVGSLGDRPWLSKERNAKDLYDAIMDYCEQGYRYDSLQKPLNELHKMLTNTKVQESLPNTVRYLEKYKNHITGQNLNAVGVLTNSILNAVSVGFAPSLPIRLVKEMSSLSATWMMGMFNWGFAGMQLSQVATSAVPEALAMTKELGVPLSEIPSSMNRGGWYTTLMALNRPELVPVHLQEAYKWGHEVGMFNYSEAQLAHEVHKSKARLKAEKVANFTIEAPEKATRGPVFMAYADLFHKAGFRGEDALLRAQEATQSVMTDYHPDERPMIYSSMGAAGNLLGALSTYKHNFVEQLVQRSMNAKKNPAAAIYVVGTVLGLYGLAGLPGYQEASQLSEQLTGRSVREWVLTNPTEKDMLLDGMASFYSDVDVQSRLSQSSMFPDTPLSAAPHVAFYANAFGKAFNAAKYQDTARLREFGQAIMPTSMRHIVEDATLTDKAGWVYKPDGLLKVERPRTEDERMLKKVAGMTPLRERIQRETLWTQQKRELERKEKLTDISKSFRLAVRNGDPYAQLLTEYSKYGGDPQELIAQMDEIFKERLQTPKQRAQGEPNGSLGSMYRYNAYN